MSLHQEEQHVRRLRDRVYEAKSTDDNWNGCKEHWLKRVEIQWLERIVTAQDVKVNRASVKLFP